MTGTGTRTISQSLAHPSEGDGQLLEHELSLEPEHPVAQPSELAIAPSVGGPLGLVAFSVDFKKPTMISKQVE